MDKFLDKVGLARLWWNILVKFDTLVGVKPVSQQIEEALENIGSSNIEVDATLSVAGKAADAKAVRDLVEDSQISLDNTLTKNGQAADAKATGDAIASAVSYTSNLASGTKIGTITIKGTPTDLYCNNDTKVTNTLSTSTKFYVTGTSSASTNTGTQYFDTGVYVDTAAGKLVATAVSGAVWNDYAEYRETKDNIEAGRVVVENGDDTLSISTERLMPGANVVSDTFGFAIGETETSKTPIAVSGRVLVYTNEDRESYKAGDPVCSGPNGTVSKMTREEVMMYPDRIIGTVSAIPNYSEWGTGKVKVNNRIWISIR